MANDLAVPGNDPTTSNETHPAPHRGRVPRFMLWFGLLGAPAAWVMQTLLNLPISSHACFPKLAPLEMPATGALRGILFLVSVLAILVSAAALVAALRGWARTHDENQDRAGKGAGHDSSTALAETGEGRTRFMAGAGVLTSLTFLLVATIHATVVFLVAPACGG